MAASELSLSDKIFIELSLKTNKVIKGATKLHFMYYSRVVIILFSKDL